MDDMTAFDKFNSMVKENSLALAIVGFSLAACGIIYDVHNLAYIGLCSSIFFAFQAGHHYGMRFIMLHMLRSMEDINKEKPGSV